MGKINVTRKTASPKITEAMAERINTELQEMAEQDANNAIQEAQRVLKNSLELTGMNITPVEAPAPQEKRKRGRPRKQQAGTPEERHLFASLKELEAMRTQYAFYMVLPTEALLRRSEDYYNANWDRINAELEPLLPEDIRAVIAEDYARILAGIYFPTATPPQMKRILQTVSPEKAYIWDKYGLYVTLFMLYSRILEMRREYVARFKTPDNMEDLGLETDALEFYIKTYKLEQDRYERRKTFMTSLTSAMEAQAFTYLVQTGDVEPADFIGIELKESIKFLDDVNALSQTGNYVSFYVVSKECLGATPQELEEITPPPVLGSRVNAQIIAEQALQELNTRLENLGQKVDAVASILDAEKRKQALTEINNARTPEDRQQAIQNALRIAQEEREQIRQQEEPTLFTPEEQGETPAPVEAPTNQEGLQVDTLTENKITEEIIRLPENFGLLLSRGLYASKDGKQANDILPISAFIEDYVRRKGLDRVISPYTVSKAVEGVNLLQRIQRVRPANNVYEYRFNISQFAELVGYKDANETQKKELLTALGVLDGLYLIVWKQDGRHAVRVLTLQSIGIDGQAKGDIVIHVTAESMAGRPNLLTAGDLAGMQKLLKGEAGSHFKHQILSKGHKEEEAMLSEVFGYDVMEAEAFSTHGENLELGLERAAKVKKYIQGHKARDKKRLLNMFEQYRKGGYINYTVTKNAKGQTVYTWERLKDIEAIPYVENLIQIENTPNEQ